jgi:hypothetical protein
MDKVAPVLVNPVPAVRYEIPSTYALVAASLALMGVGTVVTPVTVSVPVTVTPPPSADVPDTLRADRVPRDVIVGCAVFIDKVDPVLVSPVEAVR